jgi:hypothetical protein
MDPDANLREQEEILRFPVLQRTSAQVMRLIELRRALLGWLKAGGAEPQWWRCPLASRHFNRWV